MVLTVGGVAGLALPPALISLFGSRRLSLKE
jgi:hypothetical protein